MSDNREAFEAWHLNGANYPPAVKRSGDGYVNKITTILWQSWQASRNQAIEACKIELAKKLKELK